MKRGRPKLPASIKAKGYSIKLYPRQIEKIKALAKQQKTTQGKLLGKLIDNL